MSYRQDGLISIQRQADRPGRVGMPVRNQFVDQHQRAVGRTAAACGQTARAMETTLISLRHHTSGQPTANHLRYLEMAVEGQSAGQILHIPVVGYWHCRWLPPVTVLEPYSDYCRRREELRAIHTGVLLISSGLHVFREDPLFQDGLIQDMISNRIKSKLI